MAIFKACYECTERVLGCHSTCERYLAEKAENERLKKLDRSSKEYLIYRRMNVDRVMDVSAKKRQHRSVYTHK